MRKFLLFFCLFSTLITAQERIDETINFQTDPAKKYSIYIPSSYDAETPNKLMLGLHPWNTSRWDAASWCDTLINFAEANELLLICPDGGADGQIDDPIDTAFTTLLLDSMSDWYNVDKSQVYAMGFSWGGKTTYTYGLNHASRFAGFMPIGAATELSDVNGIAINAMNKPFYMIHGSNDNPNTRFYPMIEAMETAGACVESNLLAGVGHTIDFANRDAILTTAFEWLENENCGLNAIENVLSFSVMDVFPNPLPKGQALRFNLELNTEHQIYIFNSAGQLFFVGQQMNLPKFNKAGIYFLKVENERALYYQKIIVE